MIRKIQEYIGWAKPPVMTDEEWEKSCLIAEQELANRYKEQKNKERKEKLALHILPQLAWSSIEDESKQVAQALRLADEFIKQLDGQLEVKKEVQPESLEEIY